MGTVNTIVNDAVMSQSARVPTSGLESLLHANECSGLCPRSHPKGLQIAVRRFADIHRSDAKQESSISPHAFVSILSFFGAKDISRPSPHRPQTGNGIRAPWLQSVKRLHRHTQVIESQRSPSSHSWGRAAFSIKP
ncbi:hypothetical protein QQF64_032537 [Cirrhinus molitorella]|uniref:Uncharacterized protein n=1 Tax=Cirrhinus molitorella TaxID=172907 RepID=A0ABR3N048_9TELE